MTEKFTKGDWVAEKFKVLTEIGDGVAECGFSDDPKDVEEIANAHLIAAAPKMYEMLQSICSIAAAQDNLLIDANEILALLAQARGE